MRRRVALAALALALPWAALAPLAARATEVEIREYPIPKTIYPHDVWADPRPDGPVYISGQRGGVLGILDPKTGQVEQVRLGDGAAPHGVVMDKAGDVWLTDDLKIQAYLRERFGMLPESERAARTEEWVRGLRQRAGLGK